IYTNRSGRSDIALIHVDDFANVTVTGLLQNEQERQIRKRGQGSAPCPLEPRQSPLPMQNTRKKRNDYHKAEQCRFRHRSHFKLLHQSTAGILMAMAGLKGEELFKEMNYLNIKEYQGFCDRHKIPYHIHIEIDGRLKKTSEKDRKN